MMTANRIHKLLEAVASPEWNPLKSSAPENWRVATSDYGVAFEMDLPGVKLDDIQIHAEGRRLSVELKPASESPGDSARLNERRPLSGAFEFVLPFHIQADLTDVVLQHGVLQISIRKPAEALRQSIPVQAGKII